jgi:hypothetical protein
LPRQMTAFAGQRAMTVAISVFGKFHPPRLVAVCPAGRSRQAVCAVGRDQSSHPCRGRVPLYLSRWPRAGRKSELSKLSPECESAHIKPLQYGKSALVTVFCAQISWIPVRMVLFQEDPET